MRSTKFALSLLSAATLALTLSACNTSDKSNTTTVTNTNQPTSNQTNSNQTTANTPTSASNKTSSTICDARAYVLDKDPNGLNVRDASSESGNIIGRIPLDSEGTVVHMVASSSSVWVQIDKAETTAEKVVFNKKGWVSGNLLGTSTRGYTKGSVNLYAGGAGSKVLGTIPRETELTISGCDGDRVQVKYKDMTGWLDADSQCPNPVTNCN